MAQARWWLFGLVALLPLVIAAGLVERHLMHDAATMRLGASLIGLLWGWLFAAVVLGIAVGTATWRPGCRGWLDRPVGVALAVLGVAVLLAIAGWPAGRAGHWLDLGLLLVFAYALGCWIGWGLREVAEAPPDPEVARVLAEAREAYASGSEWASTEPSPFGRPAYLSKPGREVFFLPGAGITDPRQAAAMVAARDAAAGIVCSPAPVPPAPVAERPPYLTKPGRLPFYLPGAGITDPRTAVAMHPVWHGRAAPSASTPATPAAASAPPLSPQPVSPLPVPVAPPSAPPAATSPAPTPSGPAMDAVAGLTSSAHAPEVVVPGPEALPIVSNVPEPTASPPVLDQDKHAGERPPGLVAARDDTPDRLQRIRGIGPQNEVRLNALGIWHFAQIAAWTPAHKAWVASYLAFPGRIEREQWIEQARVLAAGGMGAKDNPVPRPRRPRA